MVQWTSSSSDNVVMSRREIRTQGVGMFVHARMRGLAVGAAIAGLAAMIGVQGAAAAPAPQVVSATPDRTLTDAWRQFGDSGGGWADRGGWAASDGTYSTELPGHRVVWLLNDTFMGPVNADESLPLDNAFVHNSAVLGG